MEKVFAGLSGALGTISTIQRLQDSSQELRLSSASLAFLGGGADSRSIPAPGAEQQPGKGGEAQGEVGSAACE